MRLAISNEASVHVHMDEIPTITIYSHHKPMEQIILATQSLSYEQVNEALALYAEQHDTIVGTVIGVSMRAAVFTPVKNWGRDNKEPASIYFVSWDEIQTLLNI